jgi:Flp pilus assembly protein TadD
MPHDSPVVLSSTQQPTTKEIPRTIKSYGLQESGKAHAEHSVVTPLKEKTIPAEELAKTSNSGTHSSQSTASPSMMIAGPAADPLQVSLDNRLHQGQLLIRGGKYDAAVALLSPLFHDPPVNWQPWFWMGTALLGKGETEQADQFFLSGLARNDKIPQLWIQRALVAQQRGDYQLAIHELRQAESLEADLPHIPLNLGYAYEQLGNNRLANHYYGEFLKLSEGIETFFSIRKKLFSRLTHQTSGKTSSSP